MPVVGRTPNFALALAYGNRQNWTDLNNDNFRILDALIATYVNVANLQGIWINSFEYTVGDNVVDSTSGVVYTAQVNHTSASVPTTFAEERTNNPTYWLTFSVAARNRGAWQTNTSYSLNDFVIADGTKYAVCIQAHTSGANFDVDAAAGKWDILIDVSTAAVLPILSGGADANKTLMADSGGNSYVLNSASTLAGLLIAAGLAPLANPTFTGNPAAPTPTAEDNDTSIATTAYADAAVRALVIRRQTFSVNGTYTPHAKMIYCDIECWGGGGGGGGTVNTGAAARAWGGGGGSGGYSKKTASKATIGANQTVTIGTAGAGGAAGNNTGTAGGATSVGVICVANGGSGGTGQPTGTIVAGGAGGIAGTGDIAGVGITGNEGGVSDTNQAMITGRGGSMAPVGSSGTYTGMQQTGPAAIGFAAGGGGGASSNAAGAAAGGAGSAGYVVVTEFCYG